MTEKRFRVFKIDEMYRVIDDKGEYTVAWDNSKVIMDDLCDLLNKLHETITDNEEYIKDLEYQLKGFKKDYNDCGEYLKEYQQKVKDTLQWIYNDSKIINSKERQKTVKLIAKELGIDLQ